MENELKPSYQEPLENLLSITSPSHLKGTILDVYFNYLIHLDKQCIPDDFTMMAEDIYLIIQFLDEVDLIRGKKLNDE